MDIRKVKKLIELLEESNINELEITEGEDSVRISRGVPAAAYAPQPMLAAPLAAAPAAAQPPPAAPAPSAPQQRAPPWPPRRSPQHPSCQRRPSGRRPRLRQSPNWRAGAV